MNTTREKMTGYLNGTLLVLGVILCSYHLSAAMLGTITVMRQRVFHVGLVLLITLFTTLRKRLDNPKWNPGKLLILWEMVSDLALFSLQ